MCFLVVRIMGGSIVVDAEVTLPYSLAEGSGVQLAVLASTQRLSTMTAQQLSGVLQAAVQGRSTLARRDNVLVTVTLPASSPALPPPAMPESCTGIACLRGMTPVALGAAVGAVAALVIGGCLCWSRYGHCAVCSPAQQAALATPMRPGGIAVGDGPRAKDIIGNKAVNGSGNAMARDAVCTNPATRKVSWPPEGDGFLTPQQSTHTPSDMHRVRDETTFGRVPSCGAIQIAPAEAMADPPSSMPPPIHSLALEETDSVEVEDPVAHARRMAWIRHYLSSGQLGEAVLLGWRHGGEGVAAGACTSSTAVDSPTSVRASEEDEISRALAASISGRTFRTPTVRRALASPALDASSPAAWSMPEPQLCARIASRLPLQSPTSCALEHPDLPLAMQRFPGKRACSRAVPVTDYHPSTAVPRTRLVGLVQRPWHLEPAMRI